MTIPKKCRVKHILTIVIYYDKIQLHLKTILLFEGDNMDKILKIERAKMYLNLLSNGINPVSGQTISPESGFPDEKIRNCFAFITEILDEYVDLTKRVEELEKGIDSNKVVITKKLKFAVTEEQCSKIRLSEKPITVMAFMKNINMVIDDNTMVKLSSTRLKKWLMNRGLFSASKAQIIVNKTIYKPSELAGRI